MKDVNTTYTGVSALNWTLDDDDDDDDSFAVLDQTLSNQYKASFKADRSNLSRWIDSIRTPGPSVLVSVQPSPHLM